MANVRHLLLFYVSIFVFTKSSYSLTTTTPASPQESDTCVQDAVAPFIVSLEFNGEHVCAGSILSENWVVTAAFCLHGHETEVMDGTLVAGSTLVGGNESTTQKRSINYFVVHELYTPKTGAYEIGLIYTATPFTWSRAVAAINLPASDYKASGNATSYGWDTTDREHPVLQAVNVPIISLEVCKSEVEEISLRNSLRKVDETRICTHGVGSCNTDCTGPLIEQTNDQNVLIGVPSFGAHPCSDIGALITYMQVSSLLSWIKDHQVVPSKSDLFNV